MVNSNNHITTQITKKDKFSPQSGFEALSLGTKSQCTTNELHWPQCWYCYKWALIIREHLLIMSPSRYTLLWQNLVEIFSEQKAVRNGGGGGGGVERPLYVMQNIYYLKSKLNMENEQISTPLPAIAVKIPPIKPVKTRTIACQRPKLTIVSNVLRFFSL